MITETESWPVSFQYGAEDAGGVGHVPPGWSFWYALVCDLFLIYLILVTLESNSCSNFAGPETAATASNSLT